MIRSLIWRNSNDQATPDRRIQHHCNTAGRRGAGGMVVMEPAKTVRLILEDAIKAVGADGVFNADAQCACLVGDLAPCDQMGLDCQIGYRRICSCGDWFLVADRASTADRCPLCAEN
jgi:hypothetical protein